MVFFAFDSHSRSSNGLLSVSGKSVRILFDNPFEVYSHIQNLALSMGYSKSIECNLTGVSCTMNSIENDINFKKIEKELGVPIGKSMLSVEGNVKSSDQNDDVIFISQEQFQFTFSPLSTNSRKELCQKLNMPYICTEDSSDMHCPKTNIATQRTEKEIIGDGNCFFRAISFSLTNSEDFHNIVRNAVCEHMLENRELFHPFLNNELSVETHLLSSQMLQEGTWATEIEIFATAHLLNTDIYTFSGGCWVRFSIKDVESSAQNRTGAIYLNHRQQNHYDVVLSVNTEETDLTQMPDRKIPHEYI